MSLLPAHAPSFLGKIFRRTTVWFCELLLCWKVAWAVRFVDGRATKWIMTDEVESLRPVICGTVLASEPESCTQHLDHGFHKLGCRPDCGS